MNSFSFLSSSSGPIIIPSSAYSTQFIPFLASLRVVPSVNIMAGRFRDLKASSNTRAASSGDQGSPWGSPIFWIDLNPISSGSPITSGSLAIRSFMLAKGGVEFILEMCAINSIGTPLIRSDIDTALRSTLLKNPVRSNSNILHVGFSSICIHISFHAVKQLLPGIKPCWFEGSLSASSIYRNSVKAAFSIFESIRGAPIGLSLPSAFGM